MVVCSYLWSCGVFNDFTLLYIKMNRLFLSYWRNRRLDETKNKINPMSQMSAGQRGFLK